MSILKVRDKDGNFVDVPVISGRPASIKVGEVKLLEPNSEPTIENVGTEYDAIFNFGIPKGEYIVQGENFKLDLSDYAKQKQLDIEIENRQQKDNSLQSQIKSLASGSPLVASSTDEMTDKKRVYVNTSDGNWYYYDGSNWISGGIYQANGINNESITPEKTTFLEDVKIQLCDNSKNTPNSSLNNNGELITGSFSVCDYIEVEENEEYYRSVNWLLCFYDENKTFLSKLDAGGSYTITIPESCKYIRNVFPLNSNFIFVKNKDSLTNTNSDSYKLIDFDNSFKQGIQNFINDSFNITYPPKSNMCDNSKNVVGLLNEFGSINTNTQYVTSDYIYVAGGSEIHINNRGARVCFYNFDKTHIGDKFNPQIEDNAFVIKIPLNASYMRISNNPAFVPVIKCVASDVPFDEVTDYVGLKSELNIYEKQFNEVEDKINLINQKYIINCLGDSITQGLTTNNVSFADMLNTEYGYTINKYGVSGTTITKQNDVTNSFLERYSGMDDNCDIILVMGGTNDFGLNIPLGSFNESPRNNYTFYGALKSLMEGLIQKYPDKKIAFITELDRSYPTNSIGVKFTQYIDAIKECARNYAIPVLDLNANLGFNAKNSTQVDMYIPDQLHPNLEGHKIIASKIDKYIKYIL